jgi:CRISP-associated protein Cas1
MATLYLNEQRSVVKKRDGYLIVQYPDKRSTEVPLIKVSQVVVSGDVTLTTPALHTLLEMGIEVCFLSMYGHFRGRLSPPVAKNALLRREQYRAHADQERALKLAQVCGFIRSFRAKSQNTKPVGAIRQNSRDCTWNA